jgi:hypothetical protein
MRGDEREASRSRERPQRSHPTRPEEDGSGVCPAHASSIRRIRGICGHVDKTSLCQEYRFYR